MIEDFTNPHKGLTPIRVEDNAQESFVQPRFGGAK